MADLRKFTVDVTQTVEVTLDAEKFDAAFMKEFRDSFYAFFTLEPRVPTSVGVIQADRDWAAEFFARHTGYSNKQERADVFRRGEMDDHDFVQTFARHREESSTPALDDRERLRSASIALEPFAKLAESYDPPENDDDLAPWDLLDGDLTLGDLRRARSALASIRSGDAG